ncbi:MAG: PKD domain-containing protein, partial [Acidobacteriota bacterium]
MNWCRRCRDQVVVGRPRGVYLASNRIAAGVLAVIFAAGPASAYYEDLDTPTSHSTFHYELMRVLARAAGFSAADAELLAVANQAVDLLAFTGEAEGSPTVELAGTSRLEESTAKYFHFPRRNAANTAGQPFPGGRDTCAYFTGTSEACAAGISEANALEGWAVSASGQLGVATPQAAINHAALAPVAGRSLVALAIYLHSLGDSFSHEKCMQESKTRRHCLPTKPDCPMACSTELWHVQAEYGSNASGVSYTKEAVKAVWQALKLYRTENGLTGPALWDDAQASSFADAWAEKDRAALRRDLANSTYEEFGECHLECRASVAAESSASLAATFAATVTATGCADLAYAWEFGDGAATVTTASGSYRYVSAGTFLWSLRASSGDASCSASG